MRGLILFGSLFLITTAVAKDTDGTYAQNPNHEWVHGLHSPSGSWCCDITDGHAISNVDLQTKDNHYQVRIENQWIVVPDSAVITEPNRIGVAIVWYIHIEGKPVVSCLLPGAGI